MVWIIHEVSTRYLNCSVSSSCIPLVVSDFGSPILTKMHLIRRAILVIFLGKNVDIVLYSTVRLKSGLMIIKIALTSHLSYGQ